MGIVLSETYEQSVVTFLSANEWVGDSEAPLLTSLLHVARLLDLKTAAHATLPTGLTQEFRMLFVDLLKRKPEQSDDDVDDFDETIDAI
ncbi:hypothetical protein [Rhodococcoides fascians]|uniref:hypothetical protein n=1 Tax=Rhodococcoides fascians TaxID=1828 RepID=UPI00117B87D0|nr:hypothetical protein [Rhodococcus fascians]